jgi:hypothetical protein
MAQIIEIPGVGEVEFPDEMDDASVLAAVKKLSAPAGRTVGALPLKPRQPIQQTVSGIESGARGGLQGLSADWGDEGAAGIAALLPFTDREAAKGDTIGERYRNARDFYRGKNAEAEQANPGTYLVGQVGGAVGSAALAGLPTAGAKGLAAAAGQGAAQGAGLSEREGLGLASDTALGGGLGVAGFGAGAALGAGAKRAATFARTRLGAAHGRAVGQATEDVTEALNSLRGKYGGARQNESRAIEVLLRAESTGALSPQQATQLAALKSSPAWVDAIQNVATNYMDDFGGLAGSTTAAKGAYQQAAQNVPADVAKRAAELTSLKEAGKQVGARAKRYGVPLLGTAVGTAIGGPLGGAVGALAGAGTRPAVHAIRRMAQHPAVQTALWEAMQGSAKAGGAAGRVVQRLSPALPALLMSTPNDEDEAARALAAALMSAPAR